jgi:hypothetical protein
MESEEFPDEEYVEVREVYYDYIGKPIGHCTATMGGEDAKEIKQYLEWALEALAKPVLSFKEDE